MFIFLIIIHVIVSIALVLIVLIQSGRGGGLTEGFQRAEVLFGAKTNVFLTRTTTVLAIMFFLTCLGLAFLSAKQGQSLMENIKTEEKSEQTAAPISVAPKRVSQDSPKIEEKTADTQAQQLPQKIEEQSKLEQTEEMPKTE